MFKKMYRYKSYENIINDQCKVFFKTIRVKHIYYCKNEITVVERLLIAKV
jgi:hypothetical protein